MAPLPDATVPVLLLGLGLMLLYLGYRYFLRKD